MGRMAGAEHSIPLRRAGRSGLHLPVISLGLWQNFGVANPEADQRDLVWRAVDRGVVHLDLANNYGPPAGAAEANLGRMLPDLPRDELIISTKAGFRAGVGPYQEGGSRRYLLSSLDASLRRLGLDYVDIFYSHRYDANTPLAETMDALATAVSSGRALYAGISSYSAIRTREAVAAAHDVGLRLAVHQASYSMINRWIEKPAAGSSESLLDVIGDTDLGLLVFSPLAQGMLTERYLAGIPADSRAARDQSLKRSFLSEENLSHVRTLAALARERGQSLAAMALAWAARDPRVSSVVIGARTTQQFDENLAALAGPGFSDAELAVIDALPVDTGINIWGSRSSDL